MRVGQHGAVPWGVGAAMVAVLLTITGIAVGAGAPPQVAKVEADSGLVATGAVTGPAPEHPSTTTLPTTSSTPPGPSTTRPAPATTLLPVTTTPPAPVTTTLPSRPTTSLVTTTTAAPAPSSWRMDDKGISMRLWIEPAVPRVGDTVTFFFETWATVPTDFCCMNHFYVEGELIYSRLHDQGPCPLAPSARRQQVSHVVTEPGPLAFQLQANRVDLCNAPPTFTTDNLHASVNVLP
jgi:hypothetical protein